MLAIPNVEATLDFKKLSSTLEGRKGKNTNVVIRTVANKAGNIRHNLRTKKVLIEKFLVNISFLIIRVITNPEITKKISTPTKPPDKKGNWT